MKKIFILIIIMLMLMSNVDKIKEQLGEGNALIGPILSYPNDKEIVYIADKDVTLTNNKTIKKGKPITQEELKLINIKEDLNITPKYKKDFKVINAGKLDIDKILIIVFIILVVLISLYIIKTKDRWIKNI